MSKNVKHILLVEDDLTIQQVMVAMVEALGLAVDTAANGRVCLEKVAQHHYDLIFMDCQMPEMDGFETTCQLRRQEAAPVSWGRRAGNR